MNNLHYYISLLLALFSASVSGLSSDDLTDLDNKLRQVVRGTTIATAVRLAFHDCVGGCNGCLNINNEDNAGLPDLVEDLETLYTDNSLDTLLTRADFWAYAGIYALEKAIEFTNEDCDTCDTVPSLNLTFQTGRVDCDTAPYTDDDVHLPGPHMTYDELVTFYNDEFGMTAEEAVAIMGGHTLGGADEDNSGFKGLWVVGENRYFNNGYYDLMLSDSVTWTQRDVSDDATDPKWEWLSGGSGFMLNSDMCLLKNISLSTDGESSCTFDGCGDSSGADYVRAFSASESAWLTVFAQAWVKMQSNGNFTLVDLV